MKDKELLKLMGRVVMVSSVLERTRDDGKYCWVPWPLDEPRAGWVVGQRWLQQGRRNPGLRPSWEDPGEPPSFEEDGPRTPCLLVTFWPTQNAVKVPMDSWRIANANEAPHRKTYQWTDQDREDLRQELLCWPRRENGQFVRCTVENRTTPWPGDDCR